jgi:hypothetical protein
LKEIKDSPVKVKPWLPKQEKAVKRPKMDDDEETIWTVEGSLITA